MFARKTRLRRWFLFGGIPAVALAGLFFAPRAYAFGPWGHHRHEAKTPEQVRAHMERGIEHLLDEVDASDEQRTKVEAIVDSTAPQVFALMKEGRELRQEIKAALLADQLDKARIEKARASLDALADRMTDTGMDTLVSVAEVLTPAQRKLVADKLARMHP